MQCEHRRGEALFVEIELHQAGGAACALSERSHHRGNLWRGRKLPTPKPRALDQLEGTHTQLPHAGYKFGGGASLLFFERAGEEVRAELHTGGRIEDGLLIERVEAGLAALPLGPGRIERVEDARASGQRQMAR